MRILLVNKFWKPLGGVEEHAFMLKRCFEELGHEVVPFAMASADNLPSTHGDLFPSEVDFRTGGAPSRARAAGRAIFGIETLRKLRRLLERERIDAVHVLHAYHQLGTTFLRLLERRRIPTVLSLHDYKIGCPSYRLFSDATGAVCTRCLDRPHGFMWAPATTRCWDGSAGAGAVLVVEATATRLFATYRRGPGAVIVLNELQRRAARRAGVPARRIHKVPHFVEVSGRRPRKREPHVLYVGRLVPEKGVEDAIRACAAAGVRLRVLGDGRMRTQLAELAGRLSADIEFAGHVAPHEVAKAMSEAGALIVPSLWHEVSALVIVQAMARHLPVVATEMGGTPELVGDGRGFLYRAGDVTELTRLVRRTVDDPETARAAAARAAEFARTHMSKDRWIERMRGVYATIGATL